MPESSVERKRRIEDEIFKASETSQRNQSNENAVIELAQQMQPIIEASGIPFDNFDDMIDIILRQANKDNDDNQTM